MADVEGKVAFITGGARGQGRSHAVALAGEGASVALIDIANGERTHPPAVLWLLSEKAKWVHSTIQVIDAGLNAKVDLTGSTGGPGD